MRRGVGDRLAAGAPGGSACLWPVLAVMVAGCTARASTAELYPAVVEHSGARIEAVRFSGASPFSRDTLETLIATQPSRCGFLGIPVCLPLTNWGRQEHRLSPEQVRADVASLARFYRAAGYFGTRVSPEVQPDGGGVEITFAIQRGDPIILDVLDVEGVDGILDADSLEERLPLRPGSIFDLGRFAVAWEQVRRALASRGHAYADVLRNFSVDTIDNTAVATLVAVPGPQVVVDSILVSGAEHLGRRAALRQLTFRPGDLLRRSSLVESQRNLYDLELVQIAAVGVAPDSLQAVPGDSATATVAVQLAEAPVHQVDAAVGFGTEECLRTEAQWVSRSFGGGARRLALFGSVSKIGTGEPFRLGSGGRLCQSVLGDTITNLFDYRVSADLSQPYFLSPRNRLSANIYAERLSEPKVYQREALGARLGVTRRLADRTFLGASLEAERGSTKASPALFCAAFRFCEPEIADSLARARTRNDLSLSFSHDRTDLPLNPTRGFTLRAGVVWASPRLASEVEFVRWTGEAAAYRTVARGWVAAAVVRLGNFFRSATLNPDGNFLPPEERFYAGGASSVRGFDRNELGSGVWVADSVRVETDGDTVPIEATFIPTGGTSLAVASLELRMPSPVLRRLVGLAAFLDGGAVGGGSLWDLRSQDWKLTPGVGLRLQTPVGPVRLDIAHNPYGRPDGPLLLTDSTGAITRVGTNRPTAAPGFLQRLRVHLAVGQAF